MPVMSFGDILKALEFPGYHLEKHGCVRDSCLQSLRCWGSISYTCRARFQLGYTHRACANISDFSAFNNIV